MKKLITTTALCLIICVLPLSGSPERLSNPYFLTVVFFFYLLFLTQPALRTSEVRQHAPQDKFSVVFITVALWIVLAGAIIDWAYLRVGTGWISESGMRLAGIVLLIGGTLIRIWAIRELGEHFSSTVSFKENHQLITTGPYKWVRHPSYLGAYLAILGSTLWLTSLLFFGIGAVLMLLAYAYRIDTEEASLVQVFSDTYRAYQRTSSKLFPYLH